MAYKFKPRKAIKNRFRVTGTGKLKHERTLRRHLLSGRSGDKKRALCRPDILSEGHAKNMRVAMGIDALKPKKREHDRKQNKAAVEAAPAE